MTGPARIGTSAFLSRYPVHNYSEDDTQLCEELEIACTLAAVRNASEIIDPDDIKDVAKDDEQYLMIMNKIKSDSFAENKKDEDPLVKPFYLIKDRLSICDDIIMYLFDGGSVM